MAGPNIIDSEYEAGKAAFRGGLSVKVMIQSIGERMEKDDSEESTDATMSFSLGFFEGLATAVRHLTKQD
jgi:hypothetical protein